MQIVRDLGGYSYGRSDLVRRAMSKKKMATMLQEKQYFIYGKLKDGCSHEGEHGENIEIRGCIRNGVSKEAAEEIFEDMVSFASYAFNKSHAAAYAVVAYETGYLKKYYPREFMAALMTSVMSDSKQIAKYIRNCTEMGLEVLPPSVHTGEKKFGVADGKITFGLLGVKNVGEAAIDEIVRARNEKGLPEDIFTFVDNLNVAHVNKKALESLIKAGACDCLSDNRAAMLSVYEGLLESAQNSAKKNIEGQLSLFQLAGGAMAGEGIGNKLPDVRPFPKDIQLALEKEMLGVYLTDHPLSEYAETIEKLSTISCDALQQEVGEGEENQLKDSSLKDGMSVTICGMIAGKRTLITKSNKMMAFVNLEDLYGTVEVVVFPNVYDRVAHLIEADKVVAIRGTLNFKEDEEPKILADEILEIHEAATNGFPERQSYKGGGNRSGAPTVSEEKPEQKDEPAGYVKLRLPANVDENMTLQQVRTNLRRHSGNYQVLIYLSDGRTLKTDRDLWVEPSTALRNQLIGLLGQENVKM